MLEILPDSKATLVIILGASEFPKAINRLSPSVAFLNSANGLKDYLLSSVGFDLPEQNLLYLFDSPDPSSQIDEKVRDFLLERITQPSVSEKIIRDVLVYYVGHGGFSGGGSEYFLAIRDTRVDNDLSTSYTARSLARTLKEYARNIRRYLILDSCFSAAAYKEFMNSGPLEVAREKVDEVLPPEKGTALLCASGPRDPAKAPEGATYTMFTGALLEVLRKGEQSDHKSFSFVKLAKMTEAEIRLTYDDDAVRPEIHFPEQRLGSIGDLPFFPNPGAKLTPLDIQVNELQKSVSALQLEHSSLEKNLEQLKKSFEVLEQKIETNDLIPESVELDVNKLKSKKNNKLICLRLVPENDWNTIPSSVKGDLIFMNEAYMNGVYWVLLCLVVTMLSWAPNFQFLVIPLLTLSVFILIPSVIATYRSRDNYFSRGESNDCNWQHLYVVSLLRKFQPATIIPGLVVERKMLALTIILLMGNLIISAALMTISRTSLY